MYKLKLIFLNDCGTTETFINCHWHLSCFIGDIKAIGAYIYKLALNVME